MRRSQLTTVLIFLACAITLPPLQAQEKSRPRLVPFSTFLNGVTTAKPKYWMSRPESRVRTVNAFREMRQHVLSLYQGVHVTHSFLLDTQVFDCIPITEQPSVRHLLGGQKIATPPPIEPPPTEALSSEPGPAAGRQPEEPQLDPKQVDVFGNAISCDQGTIPMERVTLEQMTRFGSLREFLQKEPGGELLPGTAPGDHIHAFGRAVVANNGGGSWLNLWDPSPVGAQDFSLSQQWYGGGTGATGDPVQTVEGGWIKYPSYFNNNKPVLFVFATKDGYATGCYNQRCPGFIQTNNNWPLGAAFANYSTLGGAQYEFQMVWRHTQGNWWLYLQKGGGTLDAVGYYPDTFFNGGQLSKNATWTDYGGETALPSIGSTDTWPPMGSGEFADQGYQYAAYQSVIHYFDLSGNSQWPTLTPVPDAPATCYTITSVPASSGGSWGAYIYFGGPGGNSC
jgi:hypothetical protein